MRVLFTTLSSVTGFIGLVFIIQGSRYPSKYRELLSESVRAVQVTQVYTEATYKITVGIAIVSIAILVAVIGILFHTNKPIDPHPQPTDTFEINESAKSNRIRLWN